MSLYENDLVDTVLSKISVDEFEPKTGTSEDVVVVGYYVIEKAVGEDVYSFVNSGVIPFRDVEVSPNPNDDGYYMVFVELDRNDQVKKNIKQLTDDISNVAGKMQWKFKTHLTDDYYDLNEESLDQHVIDDPDQYTTREDFEENMAAQEQAALEEKNSAILQFLQQSSLHNAQINENILTLQGRFDTADLEIVEFGNKDVMKSIGIAESAIKPYDSVMRTFNTMLGEMSALPIDDYIVIFHPQQEHVLVTKRC